MPQLAGFRGALWDPSKVELAKVATTPVVKASELLAEGVLVRDPTRAIYVYHQAFEHGGRRTTRAMLVAALRLEPWGEGSVRPHEATDPGERDAAIARITAAGAHTEAVFAGYRDAAREVDRLVRGIDGGRPALEVTTADGTTHRLWRLASAESIGKLRPLFAPKKLHVLDGHARYEAMLAYADTLGADAQPQYSSAKYGLACLVNLEDPTLVVGPRHRVVRGEGLTRDRVLDAARAYFIVDKLAGSGTDLARQQAALSDTVAHQPACIAMFAGDPDAWKLTLKPDTAPVGEGVEVHRALQKYDPIVVDQLLVARCMPGASLVTEPDAAAVHAAIAGGAQAGLLLRPLTLDQVIHADELGARLPAGSTAFAPPLANLVALFVDPDEDLV
jgi:hypothetical protein